MAHINLLPWRAERRKQREREFYGQLGMAFVAGLLVVIVWAFLMGQRIDNQHARNDYLKDQIKQVQTKIDKIKNLEKVRSQLLARKQIIEKLQSNRSQMVHLFDELVKTIPDSVRLTSMKQKGDHLELAGVAQSNSSVAQYMRHLDASPWLGSPSLEKTVNHHDGSRTPYSFGLGLTLSKPSDAERKAAANQKDKASSSDKTQQPAMAGSTAGAAVPAVQVMAEPTAGKGGDKPNATKQHASANQADTVAPPAATDTKGAKS